MERDQNGDEEEIREDPVTETSEDSFPASDPPSPQRGHDVEPKPADEQDEGEEQDA